MRLPQEIQVLNGIHDCSSVERHHFIQGSLSFPYSIRNQNAI